MLDDEDGREARLMIDQFKSCWQVLDPEATGEISKRQLRTLLLKLPEPMGFGLPPSSASQQAYDERHEYDQPHEHDSSKRSLVEHERMVESARARKV